MSNRYTGLSPAEADRLMHDTIATIVREELTAASRFTADDWQQRDVLAWASTVAGVVRTAIENRLAGAPCASPHQP